MSVIQSNGLLSWYILFCPKATRSLSATNLMYWHIWVAFIPMSLTGSASVTNWHSISTASLTMLMFGFLFIFEKSRHAKSQWRPSSLDMSSLEKHSPGMSPLFFSQKMDANDPLKNIPSQHANASSLSWNGMFLLVYLRHQFALSLIGLKFSMALKHLSFSCVFLM